MDLLDFCTTVDAAQSHHWFNGSAPLMGQKNESQVIRLGGVYCNTIKTYSVYHILYLENQFY